MLSFQKPLCVLIVYLLVTSTDGIHKEFFYPQGRGVPDKPLPPQDDVSSPELILKTPVVFYGEIYQSIFINSNGLLSFLTEIPGYYNIQFPLDYPIIAPFYTNIDIRGSGTINYRESQDDAVLSRATRTVKDAFSSAQSFQAKSVLIVTWEDVGYHNQGSDKVNTFQVAVITDGEDSYTELLYPQGGIQWIRGTGQSGGLPDARAQAGFIAGDGRMYTLRGSGTDQVQNLVQWSNVGNPGQWLFHVGKVGLDGNVTPPDLESQEDLSSSVPNTCSDGSYLCHSKGQCVDHETGFCCLCHHGYYGNGFHCLKQDIPVRANGKVHGVLNGVNFTDLDLQSYIVTTDGRSYTALSRIPSLIGYDMQSLNILGTGIGWLFAKPIKGALNGYQLTGGVFNHTVTITYPQTGHQVVLRQRFTGLDVFDQLKVESEIKGDIPSIPFGSKIVIKEYEEHYSRVAPGHIISHSTHVFQLEGVEIDNQHTVEQTIHYDECLHASSSVTTLRLKVAKNYVAYEAAESILRFGTKNKITPVGLDEDPCQEGRRHCKEHSNCVVDGDSFRCVCEEGYRILYAENDPHGVCIDINECSTGLHNCHSDASCINSEGSFHCQCNAGFSGDGHYCERVSTCFNPECAYHAYCILNRRNVAQCLCKPGYVGDGTVCEPEDYVSINPLPTYQVPTNHSQNLQNSVIPLCTLVSCQCPPGYRIDETETTCFRESDIAEFSDPCNVINNCHPRAQCVYEYDVRQYKCQCNSGYEGNGLECASVDPYNDGEEDECLTSTDCIGDADCVLNLSIKKYECICKNDYIKDEITKTCVLSESSEESFNNTCATLNDCHPDAECVLIPGTTRDYECRCNLGFEGDGRHECKKNAVGCNVLNKCAVGTADCKYDEHAKGFRCRCRQGYQGDGFTCTPILTCERDPSLCGEFASCLPTPSGDYACQCNEGYVGNGRLCRRISHIPGNFLLLNQGMALLKVPYQSTSSDPGRPIQIQYLQQAIGIDIDCSEGRVYWSDISGKTIQSANYSGGDIRKLISTDLRSPEGVSVDWLSRNIYWTDSARDTVEVASLDNGELRKVLVTDGLVNPRGIAVHPSRGKVFWSDWNRESPKIEWANMDGTERSIFLQGNSVYLPNSLAIDFATDELCWADAGTKNIECIGIGNRYPRTVATNCSYPFGLAISQDHYYWTDWISKKIERVTRPGQVPEKALEVPRGGSGQMYGIVSVPEACPRLSNLCQFENGKCPANNLCLPHGAGQRTCVCVGSTEACNAIS